MTEYDSQLPYYPDISSWIIDTHPNAPTQFSLDQLRTMSAYCILTENYVEACILSFIRTGHIILDSDGYIRRLPPTYWEQPLPIEYHDFTK